MLKKTSNKVSILPEVIRKAKIAIVKSEFNLPITNNLEKYCLKTLIENGIGEKQIDLFAVPGALEIPVCASIISKKKIYDAIIALGAVIKGETYHFELVANECGRGCMNVALESGTPVIFEVLCVNNIRQAKARAGNNDENKGIEAATTALKMLQVLLG